MNIVELEDHIRDTIKEEVESYVKENNNIKSLTELRNIVKNLMEDLSNNNLINKYNVAEYNKDRIEIQFGLLSSAIDSIPIKIIIDTSDYNEDLCIFKQLDKILLKKKK
tara:strand:+ start:20536 stop:20862 length:327 start_codon:yes stop_codon:yes gene_type:complete